MSHPHSNHTRPVWRRVSFLLVLAVLGVGLYLLATIGADSKRLEQLLIDRFGAAGSYLPPVDGNVPPERIEKFMLVRQAVQSHCVDAQTILDDITSVAEIEDDQSMPATQKMAQGISSFKGILNAAPSFLAFMEARNTALLEHEIGLGEYLYLYLSAYGPQLALEQGSRYSNIDEAYISPRTREDYADILNAQLIGLEAMRLNSEPHQVLAANLGHQLGALEDPTDRSPWPHLSIDAVVPTLKPYEAQLSELYCSGIVQTELKQKNRLIPLGD